MDLHYERAPGLVVQGVGGDVKEKTPMKKKLLSLALVLAMALTLLPTAALAAQTHSAADCQGSVPQDATWTSAGASGHTTSCSETGCTITDDHTFGNWADSKRTCAVCSYEETCTHAMKTWAVDTDATKCKETCDTCGTVTTAATAHVYDKTAATPTGKCTHCQTAHATHSYPDKEATSPSGKCND